MDIIKYFDIILGVNVVNDMDGCEVNKVGKYIDGSKDGSCIYDKKYYLYLILIG